MSIVYLPTIETSATKMKILGAFSTKLKAIDALQEELVDKKLIYGLCKTCELSWPCSCQECECRNCKVTHKKHTTLEELNFIDKYDETQINILEMEIE